MVKLTIDNCEVVVPEHTTILDAAKSVGIQIPTLCYLRDLNEIGGCRVCVVEVESCDQLVAACNNYVLDGMVVHTNSPKAREARRTNVQLLLSQHDSQCTSCVRSGNCNLQTIANDLGIFYLPYQRHLAGEGWDFDFPIIRENDKCIKCMRCIKVCESVQGLGIWDLTNRATHTAVGTRGRAPLGKTDCVACGQCITHCPTGALRKSELVPEEGEGSFLEFSAADCVQCNLCADACLKSCLTVSSTVSTEELFDFEPRLIHLPNPPARPGILSSLRR
ncbi:MAG: 2Fe-2S iron-sulfur cluster-binding protein [Collinsella sp.]